MMTINSYVSKGFFHEFIQNKPKSMLSDDFKNWLNLYRFFHQKKATVRLSGTRQYLAEMYAREDEMIRKLVDDYYSGNSNVILENWDNDTSELKENINTNSFQFFFTSSQESIDDRIINLGFPVYNSSTKISKLAKFTNFEALPVSKRKNLNTLNNFKELVDKLLPYNSVVLVDNYIFSSDWAIENNSKHLIKSLANKAKMLNNCFHLTIFFYDIEKEKDNRGKPIPNKEKKTIEALHAEISQELEKIFVEKNKFNLSIIRTNESKDFHDRAIFTNSQFLFSGNSFSQYFNKFGVSLASPTMLTIYPLIGEYSKGFWGEIAFEILDYLCKCNTNSTRKVGDNFKNRLLQ